MNFLEIFFECEIVKRITKYTTWLATPYCIYECALKNHKHLHFYKKNINVQILLKKYTILMEFAKLKFEIKILLNKYET